MNLTQNFTLGEAMFSSTALRHGIDNAIPESLLGNVKLAAVGMEEVRSLLGDHRVDVDSWYRCGVLNGVVNGSKTSAHMDGYAVDFVCRAFGTPLEIVRAIAASGIKFDQCIQEGRWVHISFDPKMRGRVLTAHFKDGVATYTEGVA
jgi:hypothetical protein